MKHPKHVAIIMDGNGRWAKERGLVRVRGHEAGAKAVREVIQSAIQNNVDVLTLFAFSTENWNRPAHEVNVLMQLLGYHLRAEQHELKDQGVKLRVVGQRDRLPRTAQRTIAAVEEFLSHGSKLELVLALSYGGQQEISDAAKRIAADAVAGKIAVRDIDHDKFSSYLWTAELPPVDLLIRTSGEKRLSNFMLWQLAYTELDFCQKYWPDFSRDDFTESVQRFCLRDRRFGNIKENYA